MDYTSSPDYVIAENGQRMHQDEVDPRTRITAGDHNSVIWSLMEILKAAGLGGMPFDAINPESYQLLLRALGILFLAKSTGDDMALDIQALQDALANLAKVATTGNHADLLGMQGGKAGEQFHLSQAQVQSVVDMANSIETARSNANAVSMLGMALSASGVAPNYTVKTFDLGGGTIGVRFVPIDQVAVVTSGQQRYLRTSTETLFGTQYYDIGGSPQVATDPVVSAVNASTAPNTDNLISRHIGLDRGVPYTIEAGTWTCKLWTQPSAASGNTLKIVLEKYDETTGARMPIMTVSYPVTTTVMSEDSYAFDVPRIDLAATERFALSFYCFSTSNNRTITLNFGGGGYQSGIVVPDVLDHDELSGLKGNGTYHLSQAERDKLNGLAAVASTGSYNDLANQPAIPAAQVNADWNAASGVAKILNRPTLATVATSGSYADLSNKPVIPAAQVNADWNAGTGVAMIVNKPNLAAVATSGSYNDLTNKPAIPSGQVNSDWNANSGVAQIINKPTIPAAQVNADWNAASGVAMILNKPALGGTTSVQVITASTTWNKPAGAKAVHFRLVGAGAGGASGYVQSAAGGSAGGGGGGGGGALTELLLDASLVANSCAVVIGNGGNGGVGNGGVAGQDGGDTYVNISSGPFLQIYAQGGRKGNSYTGGNGGFFAAAGGYAGLAGGGQGGSGASLGSAGTYGNVFYNGTSGTSWGGGTGGGGGGGIYNGSANPGGGSWCGAGVNGGSSGGSANGATPSTPTVNFGYVGFGGPGGGGNASANGAAGANGGMYGGGGGGGGAGAFGFAAGAGGSGAPGVVVITTFF